MKVYGLTGGISSGKSTASNLFKSVGFPVIDLDELARVVVRPGKPAYKSIVKHFGTDILLPNGEIDRTKLANLIFRDAEARKVLNKFTHTEILKEAIKKIVWHFIIGTNVIILDSPLLFETKTDRVTSKTIVVWADNSVQLERLMARDNIDEPMAKRKIDSQMSLESKRDRADYVLNNMGSKQELREQVESLAKRLKPTWKYRLMYHSIRATLLFALPLYCLNKMLKM